MTTVSDSGIGIEEEKVDKLFKLFGLVGQTSVITTNGIGLGLSICKQLVEKLGGKIKLKTAVDKGTKVKFTLPFKCLYCE